MELQPQTTGSKFIDFLNQLTPNFPLPDGISIMHPYKTAAVRKIVDSFYHKFYNDTGGRILILGINPGRWGAGVTGIPFTDPVRLDQICGIPNELEKRKELSGEFIYEMMKAYGGPEKFYRRFVLSSLCPLGFVSEGKNLNYYDQRELQEQAGSFIIESIKKQKAITHFSQVCLCLGQGKNYKYFYKLNEAHHFFTHIFSLPHPRYIMQYKRKQKETYIQLYLKTLEKSISLTRENH